MGRLSLSARARPTMGLERGTSGGGGETSTSSSAFAKQRSDPASRLTLTPSRPCQPTPIRTLRPTRPPPPAASRPPFAAPPSSAAAPPRPRAAPRSPSAPLPPWSARRPPTSRPRPCWTRSSSTARSASTAASTSCCSSTRSTLPLSGEFFWFGLFFLVGARRPLALALVGPRSSSHRRPPPPPLSPLNSPTEITAFSDRYEEFKKLNTEVLGVSVEGESLVPFSRARLLSFFFGGAPPRDTPRGKKKHAHSHSKKNPTKSPTANQQQVASATSPTRSSPTSRRRSARPTASSRPTASPCAASS